MTHDQVKQISNDFVHAQAAAHSQKHGTTRKFTYTFQGAAPHPRLKGQWSAIFEVRSPEGNVIDGPVIVLVDDKSGDVRFLD